MDKLNFPSFKAKNEPNKMLENARGKVLSRKALSQAWIGVKNDEL